MKTQAELRAFTWGVMAGLVVVVATLHGVSYFAGIKWQPVSVEAR